MKAIHTLKKITAAMCLLAFSTACSVYVHDDPPPPPCCPAPPPPPPCVWGVDGAPGAAFFGLDWTLVAPSYVWTNNPAIPYVFQYDAYYNSMPGSWHLYYEGAVVENCCPVPYYWEVDFQVWAHPGSPGGCGFDGVRGADSWLMLVCGPYGPFESRTNKQHSLPAGFSLVSESDTEIVTRYEKEGLTVQMTYHKLSSSKKGLLDPQGEKKVPAS